MGPLGVLGFLYFKKNANLSTDTLFLFFKNHFYKNVEAERPSSWLDYQPLFGRAAEIKLTGREART